MQQLRQHFLTNKQVGKAVSAQLCVGVATFGTTVNGVFYGGKPMGGENNWICIFEADWGCTKTTKRYKNAHPIRGAHFNYFKRARTKFGKQIQPRALTFRARGAIIYCGIKLSK